MSFQSSSLLTTDSDFFVRVQEIKLKVLCMQSKFSIIEPHTQTQWCLAMEGQLLISRDVFNYHNWGYQNFAVID